MASLVVWFYQPFVCKLSFGDFFAMGRHAGFKSWAERRKIVDEAYSARNIVPGVARKHGVGRRLIRDWRAKPDKLNDQGEIKTPLIGDETFQDIL